MLTDLVSWAGIAGLAIIVSAAYLSGKTGVALGALFVGASFSGVTAPLGGMNVRLEMPAIALLAVLIIWRQPGGLLRFGRANLALFTFATLYFGPQFVSSALIAEEPAESLKIVGWLGLSMVGMVVAAVLVFQSGSDLRLPRWIVWAAAVQVAVGLGAVISQAFFATTWGVEAGDVVLGKARGLSWEANILAINLAMALAFATAPSFSDRTRRATHIIGLIWLSIGLGLAYSRGGLIALAIATVAVAFGLAWIGRRGLMAVARARVVPVATFSALALATALVTIQVQAVLGEAGVGWTPGTVLIEDIVPPDTAEHSPGGESQAPRESPLPVGESQAPRESPSPVVRHVGTGDTWSLRMKHIFIAIGEVASSPLIGLGTDSYRQRHENDHISNLIVATVYEGGALALLGLAAILGMALRAAWRLRQWGYLGALVVLIVGYQATDAFRFASNWIVIGTIVGLWTASQLRLRNQSQQEQSDGSRGP